MTESPVDRLLATLDLQEVGAVEVNLRPTDQTPAELPALVNEDVTVFLGQSERMPHHRVFGGQVLAQGVIACGRTITGKRRPTASSSTASMRLARAANSTS